MKVFVSNLGSFPYCPCVSKAFPCQLWAPLEKLQPVPVLQFGFVGHIHPLPPPPAVLYHVL